MNRIIILIALAGTILGSPAFAASLPRDTPKLESEELARFDAREAGQGATADETHFYAIVNSAIGKYDKKTGERVDGWSLERGGPIKHVNSCIVKDAQLVCAHSNFPAVPQASSLEIFDTGTMEHVASHSFGIYEGSLTWADWHDGAWWLAFAHYGDVGGVPGKNWRWTSLVKFSAEWQREAAWIFPESVLQAFAPMSSSGGAWGEDGLLYVLGHDHKQMYVLKLPEMGVELDHVATIEINTEGQAFDFDPVDPRVVWSISRPNRQVVKTRLPKVKVGE